MHATADRALVVCHDDTVDRTTDHHGALSELTLAQVREMDNAFWWIEGDAVTPGRPEGEYPLRGRAPEDRRLGVATLEEVVTAFPGVVINLDIKGTAPQVEPYEALLAEEISRLGIGAQVIVASFHDEALAAFRALAPQVATSAATMETATFFFSLAEGSPVVPPVVAFQVPDRFGEVTVVDERFVEAAHGAGVAVHVWTINEESAFDELVDLGVDGIISDRPSALAAALARREVAWDGRL